MTAKFEGYIERLHVNTTGQPVGRGQPLFEVYSPELVSAQREYAIAAQGVGQLNEAGGEAQSGDAATGRLPACSGLKNWDISDEQIKALGPVRQYQTHADLPRAGGRHRQPRKRPCRACVSCPGKCSTRLPTFPASGSRLMSSSRDIATVNVGQIGKNPDQRLPRRGLRGPHRLRLSDAQGGNADGAGAY